jgi:anti-sigma regulatory factor (Ser/Thr protein kinase)
MMIMAIAGMQLFGGTGVWLAQPLADILSLLSVLIWITAGLGRLPRRAEEWMKLPEGFGAKAEDVLEATVNSLEEVARLSKDIIDFLGTRGFSMRTRSVVGLCVEEMAGNVVSHGFARGRRKHSIDIRVAHKAGDIILLIRDDCTAFNPSERARAMEPDDMGKNVGIRLVYGIARDVRYQNLLGLNVLSMRI